MINKDIKSIEYHDIEKLQQDRIHESDMLDYKESMIDDEKLLKHICAFANTRGGDIIFGIKESGCGGYPEEIMGLKNNINKEKIEQLVLSNITPRLPVTIRLVENPQCKGKFIMIIRIPDSGLKPYFDSKNQKYYKRFQFQSGAMTEQEVCDCYKRRFSNHNNLEQYISANSPRKAFSTDGLLLNIIVVPSNIEQRLIDTSDYEKLKWIEEIKMEPATYCCPGHFSQLKFFAHGIKFKSSINCVPTIEIHRNGCVKYRQYVKIHNKFFRDDYVAIGLVHTLELGSKILSHYGYFGELRISVYVDSRSKMSIFRHPGETQEPCEIHSVIDREHPLQYVMDNREPIAESIMNDIVNNFGEEKCRLFQNGKLDREKLRDELNLMI